MARTNSSSCPGDYHVSHEDYHPDPIRKRKVDEVEDDKDDDEVEDDKDDHEVEDDKDDHEVEEDKDDEEITGGDDDEEIVGEDDDEEIAGEDDDEEIAGEDDDEEIAGEDDTHYIVWLPEKKTIVFADWDDARSPFLKNIRIQDTKKVFLNNQDHSVIYNLPLFLQLLGSGVYFQKEMGFYTLDQFLSYHSLSDLHQSAECFLPWASTSTVVQNLDECERQQLLKEASNLAVKVQEAVYGPEKNGNDRDIFNVDGPYGPSKLYTYSDLKQAYIEDKSLLLIINAE
jgi:hypothetical protein